VDCVFVGAGAVAEQYAAGLADSDLELKAVCDLQVERAETLGATYDATPYEHLDAMLASESAPLVVNLTSHGAHADVTRRCLAAGRHVFSEKPLALDTATADGLLELAERKGLALGVAPINHRGPAQRHAGRLLADDRLGEIRVGYAHAHVGRVTEWHDNPASFLSVGPLFDGAVYPLTLLISWFGPVERVRVADAIDAWPDREPAAPDGPAHIEAMLEFAQGPVVRLTASFYVPHRSREFYGLELHGDDGSLYLPDTGALEADPGSVAVAGSGREYVAAPSPYRDDERHHLDGPAALAQEIASGNEPRASARRAAHVVDVSTAIAAAAESESRRRIDGRCLSNDGPTVPPVRPPATRTQGAGGSPDSNVLHTDGQSASGTRRTALRLPPVGFGTSRYRDGDFVDRIDSIATALDAGYRLFDTAELYGNEARIGSLLAAPGAPDREGYLVVGKAWNTNHEHVAEACEGSLDALEIDAFDCYMLHWPEAWEYQGPLRNLAEKDPETQEALTFPTDETGAPRRVDVPLTETWERLEALVDRGLTRTLGVSNVDLAQFETIVESARIPPAVVQIESHPYVPQQEVVEACHDRGIRVMAHSPLSAPGLLNEPVLEDIAETHDVSTAAVVIAWNVERGVVPIPSSNQTAHIVENLAAARLRLTADEMARIAELADPTFQR
jgi:alcohol dehydrogenase (NADP+)